MLADDGQQDVPFVRPGHDFLLLLVCVGKARVNLGKCARVLALQNLRRAYSRARFAKGLERLPARRFLRVIRMINSFSIG